jgi:hypothetical protein
VAIAARPRDHGAVTAADGYEALSVRARLAAALLAVESWLRAYRLDDAEIGAVLDHMWQYLTVTYETLGAWYEFYELQEPEELLAAIDEEPLPRRAALICEDQGIPAVELAMLLADVVNMVYDELFGAVNLQHSLERLRRVEALAARSGISLPSAQLFSIPGLMAQDGHGWGRVTAAQVANWRGRP